MSKDLRKMRKVERKLAKQLRKDRLIQTRVDRRLQQVLIEEARRKRMSVSNLVRNVLEDAFGLADPDLGPTIDGETPTATPQLDHVYAWNAVVLGKAVSCSLCAAELAAGETGLIGMSDDTTKPRAWLCTRCGDDL